MNSLLLVHHLLSMNVRYPDVVANGFDFDRAKNVEKWFQYFITVVQTSKRKGEAQVFIFRKKALLSFEQSTRESFVRDTIVNHGESHPRFATKGLPKIWLELPLRKGCVRPLVRRSRGGHEHSEQISIHISKQQQHQQQQQ